jgi:hypothetical protein
MPYNYYGTPSQKEESVHETPPPAPGAGSAWAPGAGAGREKRLGAGRERRALSGKPLARRRARAAGAAQQSGRSRAAQERSRAAAEQQQPEQRTRGLGVQQDKTQQGQWRQGQQPEQPQQRTEGAGGWWGAWGRRALRGAGWRGMCVASVVCGFSLTFDFVHVVLGVTTGRKLGTRPREGQLYARTS